LFKKRKDLAADLATNAFVDQILSTGRPLGSTGMGRAAPLQTIEEAQNCDDLESD
jgi:hypothetical protein